MKKAIWIRATVLALFLIAVALLQWKYGLRQHFRPERIDDTITAARAWTADLGMWGPLVFAAAGSLAVLANAPTALLNYLAVILFGYVLGAVVTLLVIAGGTSLVYLSAQRLGRPFVQAMFGSRLSRLEGRLVRRGFSNVVYVRLIFFMSPVFNWLLSISGVGLWNLLAGTLLGTAHTVLLNVWLGGIFVDLIRSGRSLSPFKSPIMLLPVGIGVVVFVVLRVIDRKRTAGE